jgi:hypothetical protein
VVLLAVDRAGGERSGRRDHDGNTCAGGSWGTCGARFDRSLINVGD